MVITNDDKFHNDGMENVLAGLGGLKDKTTANKPGQRIDFTDEELAAIYDSDGLCTAIIDIPPDDMTRAGWVVSNDTDGLIEKELKNLKAESVFNTALKYARLYRGCIIVMVTDKGALEDKLNINSIGGIRQLRVYSAARIELSENDIVVDPNSLYFDDVEFFPVRLRNGTTIPIHRSRCLVFYGELSSDESVLDFRYRYWGLPTIPRIWDRIGYYSSVEQGIAALMLEYSITLFSLEGLAELLKSGTENAIAKIRKRMELINEQKSIINSVLLGENDAVNRLTASLAGVADIMDRQQIAVSTVARIPVTKLFTRSAAGMNATGENDRGNYYDDISAKQTTKLLPELQFLTDLVGSYTYPSKTEEYPVIFNPLWEPTEVEQSTIDKANAETDNIYMDKGVLLPDEIRAKRFPEMETITIDPAMFAQGIEGDEGA